MKQFFILIFLFICSIDLIGQHLPQMEKITINPIEGRVVNVNADVYKPLQEPKGIFLMFHQAGSSRGEYNEIAQRLIKKGYQCIAVDLRSGKAMNGKENETYQEAKLKMKSTSYLEAYFDMLASMEYVKRINSENLPVYIVGSSYSASLCLRLKAENDYELNALILFSPGEYFENLNGKEDYIKGFVQVINIPIWVASAKSEAQKVEALFSGKNNVNQFTPDSEGRHGAKALWSNYVDSEEYWQSMMSFVNSLH